MISLLRLGSPQPGLPIIPDTGFKEWQRFRSTENQARRALSPDDKLVVVGAEEAIHVFHVATQARPKVLRRHTGVVGTVQFSASVVYNSESQSKTRYMLVSEGDIENKHMVIMWELDEHGKLITSASIHT